MALPRHPHRPAILTMVAVLATGCSVLVQNPPPTPIYIYEALTASPRPGQGGPGFVGVPTYTPIPLGTPLPTPTPYSPPSAAPESSPANPGANPLPVPIPTVQVTGEPLVINYVKVGKGTRLPDQPNVATVKITVTFSGGLAPYQFYDEGVLMPRNPYVVQAGCGAAVVHTVRIVSADGQTASRAYYGTVDCP